MDADGEIRRADGTRPEAGRGSPGQVAVGFGHEGGTTLVAGRDDADAGLAETVEQAQERFAGHRERVAHACGAECIRDEPTHRPWPGRL